MTIKVAGARLLSFSLIYIAISFLFAGAGMIAFGVQMAEFHGFVSSFMTTVIVSATGINDIYKKQHLIKEFMASVWHWSFICVMYVICLNLIHCILACSLQQLRSQGRLFPKVQLRPMNPHLTCKRILSEFPNCQSVTEKSFEIIFLR
jgi:hypothetical protein